MTSKHDMYLALSNKTRRQMNIIDRFKEFCEVFIIIHKHREICDFSESTRS
jgi:hypothetical protein